MSPQTARRVLTWSLSALLVEFWLSCSLWFAPGWANGSPFGLSKHVIWPAGMAGLAFVTLMTLAAAAGALVCALLPESHVRTRLVRTVYIGWLIGYALLAAVVCALIFFVVFQASAQKTWP